MGCAFVFAVHILAIDRVTKRVAPLPVTFTSFVWVALEGLLLWLLGTGGQGEPGPGASLALLAVPGFLVPMLLSSLLATVLAMSLMNVFQRELDPVCAAILYAVEPIWTSGIAVAGGLAIPDGWLLLGGGALLLGNLVAELGPLVRRR